MNQKYISLVVSYYTREEFERGAEEIIEFIMQYIPTFVEAYIKPRMRLLCDILYDCISKVDRKV